MYKQTNSNVATARVVPRRVALRRAWRQPAETCSASSMMLGAGVGAYVAGVVGAGPAMQLPSSRTWNGWMWTNAR